MLAPPSYVWAYRHLPLVTPRQLLDWAGPHFGGSCFSYLHQVETSPSARYSNFASRIPVRFKRIIMKLKFKIVGSGRKDSSPLLGLAGLKNPISKNLPWIPLIFIRLTKGLSLVWPDCLALPELTNSAIPSQFQCTLVA